MVWRSIYEFGVAENILCSYLTLLKRTIRFLFGLPPPNLDQRVHLKHQNLILRCRAHLKTNRIFVCRLLTMFYGHRPCSLSFGACSVTHVTCITAHGTCSMICEHMLKGYTPLSMGHRTYSMKHKKCLGPTTNMLAIG